jgi:hypothetical protein
VGENSEIRTGADYRVRIRQSPAVIRVRRVEHDPAFGTVVTYRFVGESGAVFGTERCWPVAWFHDFEVSIPLAQRTAQGERFLTELNRDGLAAWWGRVQDSPAVPLWIVHAERGNHYRG